MVELGLGFILLSNSHDKLNCRNNREGGARIYYWVGPGGTNTKLLGLRTNPHNVGSKGIRTKDQSSPLGNRTRIGWVQPI